MKENSITFIGHSTLLIDMYGFRILTDPILTNWVYGVPRFKKAGIKTDMLRSMHIDLILISHAHNDHLNKKTLKKIQQKVPIATYVNNKKYVKKCGFENVIEFDYWQSKKFLKGKIEITSVPASHTKTLPWGPVGTSGGFVIKSSRKTIYFAGDTSFSKNIFERISQRFKIDILLMPIGSYSPRWMLRNEHTNPEEAIKAFETIGARKMIPIHWGSFMLALDTPKKSIKILKKKIKGTYLEKKVVILKNGETFYF